MAAQQGGVLYQRHWHELLANFLEVCMVTLA
jgi:hypothetical protein